MKAIVKTSMIMLILWGITFNSSANNATPSEINTIITNSLISVINFPEEAATLKLEGVVYLSYKVNQNGKIEILEMNYSNILFAQYMRKKISEINLNNLQIIPNESYSLKFVFNLK
jgi:surface antigen